MVVISELCIIFILHYVIVHLQITKLMNNTVVKVRAKVVEDDTGIFSHVPVLISESGNIIDPLLSYTLKLKRDGLSNSTIDIAIRATLLLLKYMAANESGFDNPKLLFELFTSRLYTGTFDDNGYDPSGLCWLPIGSRTAKQYIGALTKLTEWMIEEHGGVSINPLVEADSYSKRLNYAAWFRRNQHDFLGHIKDKHINQTVRYARNIRGKRPLGKQNNDAIEFPECHFENFFLNGIGGANDLRVSHRDKLILLLMHGGGLRESEALHLWVQDVYFDPDHSGSVKVRIYHPEDGDAPEGWKSRAGRKNRSAYLKEKHILTPRTMLSDSQHLGWKATVTDGVGDYLEVHWFSRDFGRVFAILWLDYLRLLTTVERQHPYAFVSFKEGRKGQPYTRNAFHYNYRLGLKRIGLTPSKANGLSPHSHRHSYGRRLRRAGIQEVVIKKCLHHASIASQEVYTTPTVIEVTACLNDATLRLEEPDDTNQKDLTPSWKSLLEHGFSDIDPDGLFSGKFPKLRR